MLNIKFNPNAPIGIFDSGVGGLTIAKAVSDYLPHENVIYFGDTAHMPYGDKQMHDINQYVGDIIAFLNKQACKMILIACNTATAASFTHLQQTISSYLPIMNVVDPVIAYLSQHYVNKTIGLIATPFTVQSGIYNRIINSGQSTQLKAVAARLLAPAIEEFGDHDIVKQILAVYLSHDELQQIDALLLGCTHYPLIKNHIAALYHQQVDIIDTVDIVARSVKDFLVKNNMLNQSLSQVEENEKTESKKIFFVSKSNMNFVKTAQFIFNDKNMLILNQTL